MWHVAQPASPWKSFSPFASSPEASECCDGVRERRYAIIAHVSESSNPFAGICVPGTPCVMVRNISASLEPCVHRPDVRSGPPPPPFALSALHGEQLARNSEAPSLIAAELAAAGFVTGFSCTDCPYITPICTGKYNAMSNVVRAI